MPIAMDIWNPIIGEELQLQREPENTRDGWAVAIVKDSWTCAEVSFSSYLSFPGEIM